jgi:hypothetical protein
LEGKERYFYRIRATNGVLYSEYNKKTQ